MLGGMVDLEPYIAVLRDATTKYVAAVQDRNNLLAGIRHFGEAELRRYDELKKAEEDAHNAYHKAVDDLLRAKGVL